MYVRMYASMYESVYMVKIQIMRAFSQLSLSLSLSIYTYVYIWFYRNNEHMMQYTAQYMFILVRILCLAWLDYVMLYYVMCIEMH